METMTYFSIITIMLGIVYLLLTEEIPELSPEEKEELERLEREA